MNKRLLFNIYKDSINTGSLVLKAQGQHYKINSTDQIMKLAGEVEQFMRSVVAGATPHCPVTLADAGGREYDLEFIYANDMVRLSLWLKTADSGKVLLFDWKGSFRDFGDGFKVF